jgi:[methyl-Co(III) methanol-specific corrinoid protein]:coenzyme M methyltransferase
MSRIDRRERLLRALARQPVDRAPVICTGGSMTATPEEVVALSGYTLPEAHCDVEAMAGLALAAARITGFESVGIPLCVTVEAEAYGVEIDLGDARTEARIVREPYVSVVDVVLPPVADLLRRGRVQVTVEAVRRLAATAGDLPIIANLIGPVSIAAAVVEPTAFLRELRTKPDETAALSAHVTDFLIAWSRQLIAAGADAIAIHEDTTTPALVGPRTFEQAVFPHLDRLVAAIHESGGRVLLHMCNALGKSAATVARLGCDAYIPDASLTAAELRETLPDLALVGNISTFLLHQGQPPAIAKLAARLVGPGGFDVLSPTCGMSSITPLANILAMTGAVRQHSIPYEESLSDV